MTEAERRGYKKVRITHDVGGWPVGSIAYHNKYGKAWNADCSKSYSHTIGCNCELVDNTLTIEPGKYYKTRDGRKVFVSDDDGSETPFKVYGAYDGGEYIWYYRNGEPNVDLDGDQTIISEWPTDTTRDQELTSPYGDGNHPLPVTTPRTWSELTDDEQAKLLLAHHRGEVIENNAGPGEWTAAPPLWAKDIAYRVRPQPKPITTDVFAEVNGKRVTVGTIKIVGDAVDLDSMDPH